VLVSALFLGRSKPPRAPGHYAPPRPSFDFSCVPPVHDEQHPRFYNGGKKHKPGLGCKLGDRKNLWGDLVTSATRFEMAGISGSAAPKCAQGSCITLSPLLPPPSCLLHPPYFAINFQERCPRPCLSFGGLGKVRIPNDSPLCFFLSVINFHTPVALLV